MQFNANKVELTAKRCSSPNHYKRMNKVKIIFVLLLYLISINEIAAQTDSVQYYMKVDTTQSGIRTGQDVSLRYICTVQYDSVLLPRFIAPVEMVKEAVPHRSGHAVVNGELTEIYEFGFRSVSNRGKTRTAFIHGSSEWQGVSYASDECVGEACDYRHEWCGVLSLHSSQTSTTRQTVSGDTSLQPTARQ